VLKIGLDKRRKPDTVRHAYMKNSPLTTVLLAAVAASALASLVLCNMCISATREFRTLQENALRAQTDLNAVQRLAADAVEYSKGNPGINPILEAAGLKPKSGPAPGNKPPTR
jgi:hypothetical protein